MHESDSIVIIPTYNEKENIEKIIRAVFGLEKCFHILVIDDGSPDGTASIVHRLIESEWSERCELAYRPCTDELLRFQICTYCHRL